MHRLIIFLLLVNFSVKSYCQQTGRMETDRPDQTESPFITKLKYFQVESGLNLIRKEGYSTLVVPTVLWKYGISKKIELRLITEINVLETPLIIPAGNDVVTGLVPITIGGKVALIEEKGIIPKTSVILHMTIPKAASKKFRAVKWAPSIIFLSQNTINEKIGLGYNYGLEWDGEDDDPAAVYTIALGLNMGKRWYSYVELFGSAKKGDLPENTIDGGLGYYINDNVKLDASAGIGVSKASADYFFGVGFSFRFH